MDISSNLLNKYVLFLQAIAAASVSNPSRRHLFLGQMLMGGLLGCCAMAMCLCMQPSDMTCAVLRIGVGVAYSVVYSTMLVKLVFLVSLNRYV